MQKLRPQQIDAVEETHLCLSEGLKYALVTRKEELALFLKKRTQMHL